MHVDELADGTQLEEARLLGGRYAPLHTAPYRYLPLHTVYMLLRTVACRYVPLAVTAREEAHLLFGGGAQLREGGAELVNSLAPALMARHRAEQRRLTLEPVEGLALQLALGGRLRRHAEETADRLGAAHL